MQIFRLVQVQIAILLFFTMLATACSFFSSNASTPKLASPVKISLSGDRDNLIQNVTLVPKVERIPPLGVPQNRDRDIGFASVFVRLENPQEANATVMIKSIEIRSATNGQLQDFNQPPQTIELKPLENSEIVFHLTNKTGYIGLDKVKAIVTYQIGDRVVSIESEAVALD
jgi:hypothetical protein